MSSHFCGSRNKPNELFVNTWVFSGFPLTYAISLSKSIIGPLGRTGGGGNCMCLSCKTGAQNEQLYVKLLVEISVIPMKN